MSDTNTVIDLRSKITDILYIGDTMYYTQGNGGIAKQVKESNIEINNKNKTLKDEIQKRNAAIERANRDFTDLKDTLPEKLSDNSIHFVEDYTLLFVFIAYVFMLIACIYLYTQITSDETYIMITKITVGTAFITAFFMMLLYYLA